jgi:hypothetical protein
VLCCHKNLPLFKHNVRFKHIQAKNKLKNKHGNI